MESLYKMYKIQLDHITLDFKRYLYDDIAWESRMLGIVGPRGVGKTTMIFQYIKEHLDPKKGLYVSADDLYFGENNLYDLADDLYKNAGEFMFIDEVHKYANWSRELKNIYDSLPTLKVVFTRSSVLDILKGTHDLSRRAVMYNMQGLSFREYLNFFHNAKEEVYSLEQIIGHDIELSSVAHPLPLFKDYVKRGYYPFSQETEMNLRLSQILIQTLETDMPQYANLSVGTSRKLKRLLSIISQSVPFKPNFSKISAMIGVSRNSLDDYFFYMEKAGLIAQLPNETGGIRSLGKVEKVYLDNPNLIHNLVEEKSNIGNIRETFFFNQMRVNHDVISSNKSDFVIDDYTFEVGGKNKTHHKLNRRARRFW